MKIERIEHLWIALFAIAMLVCIKCNAEERDYGRTCLALAMFSEARSEGLAAMYEVGKVALRRSRDPRHRWPQSLCEVIEEPEQFIGVWQWKTPRHPELIDADSWSAALEMANSVIAHGMVEGPCGGAYYFNQQQRAGYVCRIGALFFYGDR